MIKTDMTDFDRTIELHMPPAHIRESLLETGIAQALQEHEQLRGVLQDMYDQVCVIRAADASSGELDVEFRKLRDIVKTFMNKWEAHMHWEDNELIPYTDTHYEEEPDLFAYMEQEYELADPYLRAFLHRLDRSTVPVPYEDAHRMTSYLLQAYAFLINRLEEEDEIWSVVANRSLQLHH